MCSKFFELKMLQRNSKTPVTSGIGSPVPSTSRDHDASSDRRGAVDRHGNPGSSRTGPNLNNVNVSDLREAIIAHEPTVNGHNGQDASDNETMEEQDSTTETNATLSIDIIDKDALQDKLNDAQLKFERACQQIVLLDQKIKDLEVRYKRAVRRKQNSFRYNLRLKLSVFTGIKMMYHHYAGTKADELTRLHRQRHTSVREASTSTDARQSS